MKADAVAAGINSAARLGFAGGSGAGIDSAQNESFSDYLSQALQDVQNLQDQASFSTTQLALGEEDYIHNTILALDKANLALQLTIQVRDKVVEAFQELMRIQM